MTYQDEIHKILEAQDLIKIVFHNTDKDDVKEELKKIDKQLYKILEMYFEVRGGGND